MTTAPIRYRPDLETIAPDEGETVAELNATFDTILKRTAEDYGHAVRAVHAKAHALIRATLTIADDLPPELKQGLFARGGEHPVLVRMSTNPGDILDDAIALPRGMAIKVLDVDGERLPGAQGRTQDFIMVNAPVFQAKTAKTFAGSLKLLAKTTDRVEGVKKAVSSVFQVINGALSSIGLESATLGSLGGVPNVHPLGETFYSVTPFRYGDHVAKFSVRPHAGEMLALTGREIDASQDRDAIRDTMRADLRHIAPVWELRVQLCRDLDAQPIEDPTVEWDEEAAPFVTVGMIRGEAQDPWSDDRVREIDEETRFSVWTGLAAHRPLGDINRARRDVYEHSAGFRAARNGCPMHEPA